MLFFHPAAVVKGTRSTIASCWYEQRPRYGAPQEGLALAMSACPCLQGPCRRAEELVLATKDVQARASAA